MVGELASLKEQPEQVSKQTITDYKIVSIKIVSLKLLNHECEAKIINQG